MNALDSGNDAYHEPMSMEMLEDIRDGSQTHPNVNRRDVLKYVIVLSK